MNIGISIILVWGLIFPLTDWYLRLISKKAIKKGSGTNPRVCLTFDDGPDQRYTPEILRILHQLQVPAVFFLVGTKAERLPDLVRQIESEGHQIGCHTYGHRHAYLLSPWESLATIRKGQEVIEKITGKPLRWFRPPWGALNLFQYHFLRHSGLRIVLWNVDGRDWLKKTGASGILELLMKRIKPNSIIVLHDSGGETGAPENTVAALPSIIKKLQNEGYYFVNLEEALGGNKC